MNDEIYRAFKKKRSNQRTFGILLLVVGILLVLMVPLRLGRGRSTWFLALGGVGATISGWAIFASAYRTPVREVLMIADDQSGRVSAADLCKKMDVDPDNARSILLEMAEKRLIERTHDPDTYVLPKRNG